MDQMLKMLPVVARAVTMKWVEKNNLGILDTVTAVTDGKFGRAMIWYILLHAKKNANARHLRLQLAPQIKRNAVAPILMSSTAMSPPNGWKRTPSGKIRCAKKHMDALIWNHAKARQCWHMPCKLIGLLICSLAGLYSESFSKLCVFIGLLLKTSQVTAYYLQSNLWQCFTSSIIGIPTGIKYVSRRLNWNTSKDFHGLLSLLKTCSWWSQLLA